MPQRCDILFARSFRQFFVPFFADYIAYRPVGSAPGWVVQETEKDFPPAA